MKKVNVKEVAKNEIYRAREIAAGLGTELDLSFISPAALTEARQRAQEMVALLQNVEAKVR